MCGHQQVPEQLDHTAARQRGDKEPRELWCRNYHNSEAKQLIDTDYILALLVVAVGLLLADRAWPADNSVYIDQINNSSNNTVTVVQEGTGHQTKIDIGKTAASDYNNVSVTQTGAAKTASIEIKSGVSNGVIVNQDGAGNHKLDVQNLNGTANNINVTQNGSGSHEMNIIAAPGTTNSGNTITATQTGDAGSEKLFSINLGGSAGATVNVNQGGVGPNTSSMLISCMPGTCGTYSFNRY